MKVHGISKWTNLKIRPALYILKIQRLEVGQFCGMKVDGLLIWKITVRYEFFLNFSQTAHSDANDRSVWFKLYYIYIYRLTLARPSISRTVQVHSVGPSILDLTREPDKIFTYYFQICSQKKLTNAIINWIRKNMDAFISKNSHLMNTMHVMFKMLIGALFEIIPF